MRTGALLIVMALALTLAGCGGSSGAIPAQPHSLAELRGLVRHSIDAELAERGRPAKEIACVNRNVDAMSSRQIAERLVEAAPVEPPGSKDSETAFLGPLGRGCP